MFKKSFPLDEYYVRCQACGFRLHYKDSKIRPRDGLIVCKNDWEPIHPQDDIRPASIPQTPEIISPEGTDPDITERYPNGVQWSDL